MREVDAGRRAGTLWEHCGYGSFGQGSSRLIDPEPYERHLPLCCDESFTSVPLPSLGGKKDVEHMRTREAIPAIEGSVGLQGVIEH